MIETIVYSAADGGNLVTCFDIPMHLTVTGKALKILVVSTSVHRCTHTSDGVHQFPVAHPFCSSLSNERGEPAS